MGTVPQSAAPGNGPAATALLDQAQAAAREGWAILTKLGQLLDAPLEHRQPGPPMRAILERMRRRALSRQLTSCLHLHPGAPEPMWWAAWAPGRIRCAGCAIAVARRIQHTPEDRRCDRCRRTVPRIHPHVAQIPAVVIDLPGILAGSGPVTVLCGLCPACHLAEDPHARERP